MELSDLENLSASELRKLITLYSRQTTLKRYKHKCSAQRKCSACGITLCYACYNWHIAKVHGEQLAAFNAKLDEGRLMLPERREVRAKKLETKIKVKVRTKVRVTVQSSPRSKRAYKEPYDLEKLAEAAKAGHLSKELIATLLESLKD